jgi:hypothetical protein
MRRFDVSVRKAQFVVKGQLQISFLDVKLSACRCEYTSKGKWKMENALRPKAEPSECHVTYACSLDASADWVNLYEYHSMLHTGFIKIETIFTIL